MATNKELDQRLLTAFHEWDMRAIGGRKSGVAWYESYLRATRKGRSLLMAIRRRGWAGGKTLQERIERIGGRIASLWECRWNVWDLDAAVDELLYVFRKDFFPLMRKARREVPPRKLYLTAGWLRRHGHSKLHDRIDDNYPGGIQAFVRRRKKLAPIRRYWRFCPRYAINWRAVISRSDPPIRTRRVLPSWTPSLRVEQPIAVPQRIIVVKSRGG